MNDKSAQVVKESESEPIDQESPGLKILVMKTPAGMNAEIQS